MSRLAEAWNVRLLRMRARCRESTSIRALTFPLSLFLFACLELFQWYSTGQLDDFDRSPGRHLITHASAPKSFDVMATIYVGTALLFGLGTILTLYCKLTKPK